MCVTLPRRVCRCALHRPPLTPLSLFSTPLVPVYEDPYGITRGVPGCGAAALAPPVRGLRSEGSRLPEKALQGAGLLRGRAAGHLPVVHLPGGGGVLLPD